MAIKIKITCKNEQETKCFGQRLCEALVGSPGYINNEIFINYTDDPNLIYMIIGNDNRYNSGDVKLEIDSESIKEKNT